MTIRLTGRRQTRLESRIPGTLFFTVADGPQTVQLEVEQ
jgi:hypothetical protein